MSEQGGLSRSCLSFKLDQAPAIAPLSLAPFALSLLKLCPSCSPPPPPHPALLPLPLHFFKWSIWELCLNCPQTSHLYHFTVSAFPWHGLSQLVKNETKKTSPNQLVLWVFLCLLSLLMIPSDAEWGPRAFVKGSAGQPCKEESRKQLWAMADTSQTARKRFCCVHHHLPSIPGVSLGLCVLTQKAKPCC